MNPDYAHLLPGGRLDFSQLGKALKAAAAEPDASFRAIARRAGVDEKLVRYASRGNRINAESCLKLCIALDLNPFELIRSAEPVSRVAGSSAPVVNGGRADV